MNCGCPAAAAVLAFCTFTNRSRHRSGSADVSRSTPSMLKPCSSSNVENSSRRPRSDQQGAPSRGWRAPSGRGVSAGHLEHVRALVLREQPAQRRDLPHLDGVSIQSGQDAVEPRNIARTTSDDAKSSSVGSPEAGARVRILPVRQCFLWSAAPSSKINWWSGRLAVLRVKAVHEVPRPDP